MKHELNCCRCGIPMEDQGQWEIRLERRHVLSMEWRPFGVVVCICPQCGKTEFFDAEKFELFYEESVRCPSCLTKYPKDGANCPYCQHINEAITINKKKEE